MGEVIKVGMADLKTAKASTVHRPLRAAQK